MLKIQTALVNYMKMKACKKIKAPEVTSIELAIPSLMNLLLIKLEQVTSYLNREDNCFFYMELLNLKALTKVSCTIDCPHCSGFISIDVFAKLSTPNSLQDRLNFGYSGCTSNNDELLG